MSSYGGHHHHQQPAGYVEETFCGEERVYGEPRPSGYERVDSGYYERRAGEEGGGQYGYNHGHNNNYQRNERLGELGAVAAGAFALAEEYKAKNDPRHKHEADGYSEHRRNERFY